MRRTWNPKLTSGLLVVGTKTKWALGGIIFEEQPWLPACRPAGLRRSFVGWSKTKWALRASPSAGFFCARFCQRAINVRAQKSPGFRQGSFCFVGKTGFEPATPWSQTRCEHKAYTLIYNVLSMFITISKSWDTQTWPKMLFSKLI